MSDLEITRLCALALVGRLLAIQEDTGERWIAVKIDGKHPERFDPLRNDAQAMALVKKKNLYIGPPLYFEELIDWTVSNASALKSATTTSARNRNLNRAICECVAKVQAAKVKA